MTTEESALTISAPSNANAIQTRTLTTTQTMKEQTALYSSTSVLLAVTTATRREAFAPIWTTAGPAPVLRRISILILTIQESFATFSCPAMRDSLAMFSMILHSVPVDSGTASKSLIFSKDQMVKINFSRGSKKTTCNYICPVSEEVGVTATCKHKAGVWKDPTRPLTCNLPAECDLAALEAEAADFLSRIGSGKRPL